MSSLTSFSSVRFKDDDYPLLTETKFNQQFIEKDGNQIPISNLVLLPQVLASLDLPPNATTLKVVDTILLDDGVSVATNQLSPYQINMINTSGNTISINNDSIQQWINTTCAGIGEINLDCNTNTLFIRNFNSGGFTRLGTDTSIDNSNLILTDNKDLFVNSTTKQFFKFNDAGYGYKPKLVNQDETIQRYMNYVVMDDGITNIYLDTYTNLLDSNTLLPDRERVGWSCKFCNMNGVDVAISNTDGLNYFSHYGGLSGSPYTLKKYSVVELTLLWSGNLGQFLYAVSQYN